MTYVDLKESVFIVILSLFQFVTDIESIGI